MLQTWKTVRVFISSTFCDMHAERDYLVRFVFPELRERCAKRGLNLLDIDLRWGVTEEEAEQGKILDIILDEINRARPFFIGILGERYGHAVDKLPEDTQVTHPWLSEYAGHSFTALEIIYGVLQNLELARRSFFYFRDSKIIPKIPEHKRRDYIAENSEATQKLAALKNKIRISGRPIMESYPCQWDDLRGCVVGLDVFGQQVLEDLWSAICAENPEEIIEADPVLIERQLHESFVEEHSRLHIGRTEQIKKLTEYVQGVDRRPVVITGESGSGKSAFLANWYREYKAKHPDEFVLAYFIGASPDSTNHFRLLRNICGELNKKFNLKEEIPRENEQLLRTLAILLVAASANTKQITLILDALDLLSPQKASHGLGWLIDYIPEEVKLVVSSLEGDCLDALRRREAKEIKLLPLTTDEQRQMVQGVLGEWRRKLDERQTITLLAYPSVKNPLYLRVALEELRLFGKFDQLTTRIETLAPDASGLFNQVLERLEEDHSREMVTEVFALVGCSRYGLSEIELLDLLCRESEEQFPRALWARLTRSAKAYLVRRGELIGFFHQQFADAVAARYLRQGTKHAKLAAYFAQAPLERKLDEYPYQLQHAENWQGLAAALSDLDFFNYACDQNREVEWTGYWRLLQDYFEPALCYHAAIEAKIKSEGESEDVVLSLIRISWFLCDMAIFQSASLVAEQALTTAERVLGPEHFHVVQCLNNLAALYNEEGKYAKSLPLHRRAVSLAERTLGSDHPFFASCLHNFGVYYIRQGKNLKALPLIKRSLEIRERVLLSPDHCDIAINLNNLAGIYVNLGKFTKATHFYQRAIAIQERTLGPDHPDVAHTLNNLAALYLKQGRYNSASHLYQRAIRIAETNMGYFHPSTEKFRDNLLKIQQWLLYGFALITFGVYISLLRGYVYDDWIPGWVVGVTWVVVGVLSLLQRYGMIFLMFCIIFFMCGISQLIIFTGGWFWLRDIWGIFLLLASIFFARKLLRHGSLN